MNAEASALRGQKQLVRAQYYLLGYLPIIDTTFNSPAGVARGIVEGKEADKIHEATGSYDPLRGEVTTIKRYKEEGCSRLAVKLTQPNTPTRQGTKTDFVLNYELNLCQNGMPPRDATQFH